jgi:D-hexose-6-phosphate mutarotase
MRFDMSIDNNEGLIVLSNDAAECKISLFGGNIVSYRPKTQDYDVFWLGDLNKFDNAQAIRGGVPVCWPRFAEEILNNNLPRHGFARLSMWELKSVSVDESNMEVELLLRPDAKYNVNVSARLFIKVTDKLECSLETINEGDEEFSFSEALHSYFNVGDRDKVKIEGLQGYQYKNSLDGKTYNLENDLQIKDEFDSAFINHKTEVKIVDPVLNRIIYLHKQGSNTTVVWNPNKDLAEMSEGQYKNFVCVEPANQGEAFVTLGPGGKHKMTMTVDVKKIC